jgi:hypothetical protein
VIISNGTSRPVQVEIRGDAKSMAARAIAAGERKRVDIPLTSIAGESWSTTAWLPVRLSATRFWWTSRRTERFQSYRPHDERPTRSQFMTMHVTSQQPAPSQRLQ